MFCLGAQRYGLVLSFDGANCGAAGQKRLPLRRDLWVYRSLGLDAYRSVSYTHLTLPTKLEV